MEIKKSFFPIKIKPYLACGSARLKEELDYVSFKSGYMWATDGYILIKQSLQELEFSDEEAFILNGKYIHKADLKSILKYRDVCVEDDGILCKDGAVTIKIFFSDFKKKNLEFPDISSAIPEGNGEAIANTQIPLNLLNKLANLTLSKIKVCNFYFFGYGKAIIAKGITRCNNKEEIDETILIMPSKYGEDGLDLATQ